MCIAVISTAHPDYPLILVDNRDEFLHRPTAQADWWPEPHSQVLGSRDLARSGNGTWLGVTKQGRIAVLTNYRESTGRAVGLRSRGAIVSQFLESPPHHNITPKQYVEELVSGGDAQQAGGFSLACGTVTGPLAVVSNRVSATEGISWVAKEKDQTVALSNTAFGDRSWPKIVDGERLMEEAIHASCKLEENEDKLVQRLLGLLSTDTLPRLEEGATWETHVHLLKRSIFIPVIGKNEEAKRTADEVCCSNTHEKSDVVENGKEFEKTYVRGLYGTQTQTVVLVHKSGNVKFFERTLYDENAKAIPIGEGDRVFNFVPEQ